VKRKLDEAYEKGFEAGQALIEDFDDYDED
jgi:hypothetical protein